jgi:hypothetical protein
MLYTTSASPISTTPMFSSDVRYVSSIAEEVLQVVDRGYNICATGSRVTTNFDPLTSDYDYVVFDWDKKFASRLSTVEWSEGDSGNEHSEFHSYKKSVKEGSINFIVVQDKEEYRKYLLATELLKKMNPGSKEERIKLFDMIFKREDKDVLF